MTTISKPPHAFAVVLFAAAVIYVVGDAAGGSYFYLVWSNAAQASDVAHRAALKARINEGLFDIVRGAVLSGLNLLAAGVLIALLDSVRWVLTPEEERPELARRYLIGRVRRFLEG